jgi:hypothetical protein
LTALPVPATFPGGTLVTGDLIDVLVFLQEIRDIEERISLQAKVHESGLHSGQHSRHPPLVDTARERILMGALEVYLHQLVVFE